MNNASLVAQVTVQLVLDNLIVVKSDGKLTKRSAEAVGAAATSLAIVMRPATWQKDRAKMFLYIRDLVLEAVAVNSPLPIQHDLPHEPVDPAEAYASASDALGYFSSGDVVRM